MAVNILDFGADNTGVSCSDAAVSNAFYAALNDTGEVIFSNGVYKFCQTVIVPANIKIVGGKDVLINTNHTDDVFRLINSWNIDISNLYFNLSNTYTSINTGQAIYGVNSFNINLHNIEVIYPPYAGVSFVAPNNNYSNILLDNVNVEGGTIGINFQGKNLESNQNPTAGIIVNNCEITNSKLAGVLAHSLTDIKVRDCRIESTLINFANHGIVLSQEPNGSQVINAEITNNNISGFGEAGITGSARTYRANISNNYLANNKFGINFDLMPPGGEPNNRTIIDSYSTISNNYSANNSYHGYQIQAAGYVDLLNNIALDNKNAGLGLSDSRKCRVLGGHYRGDIVDLGIWGSTPGSGGHKIDLSAVRTIHDTEPPNKSEKVY